MFVRSEVLTAMNFKNTGFGDVMPGNLDHNQCFGGTCLFYAEDGADGFLANISTFLLDCNLQNYIPLWSLFYKRS
jgi:hypothetical protein